MNTGPLALPFARIAHSFACSALLASLARSAVLIPSLPHSLSLPSSWESKKLNVSKRPGFVPQWVELRNLVLVGKGNDDSLVAREIRELFSNF